MKNRSLYPRIAALLFIAGGPALVAGADRRGVINDPDGYVNVRAGQNAEAAVIATVRTGEPFTFSCNDAAEWCTVKLRSGKSGWMHQSRIRVHFTKKDLPERDLTGESEIDQFARGRGFDYNVTARRAADGDGKALQKFFALSDGVDGAAAESHAQYFPVVYHLLGDTRLAEFLRGQPIGFRAMVRNAMAYYGPMYPATDYLHRHFPRTSAALFPREVVAWPSPDGRYAIRKIFSDETDLSLTKVARAELIEQPGGRVRCDLTHEDIGTGPQREGEVLWSPDSKRFAYQSSNLTPTGNLFSTPRPKPARKQTVIYELSADACRRVEVPLSEPPGRAEDTELVGAIMGHEHTEPLRWSAPNVLVLQRHEYYQKLKPSVIENVEFEAVHSFDRLYEITVEIAPDGRASAEWKLSH